MDVSNSQVPPPVPAVCEEISTADDLDVHVLNASMDELPNLNDNNFNMNKLGFYEGFTMYTD